MPLIKDSFGRTVWSGPFPAIREIGGSITSDRYPRPTETELTARAPSVDIDWPSQTGHGTVPPIASQRLRRQNIPEPYVREMWAPTRRIGELPSVTSIREGPERSVLGQEASIIVGEFQSSKSLSDLTPQRPTQPQRKPAAQRRVVRAQTSFSNALFPRVAKFLQGQQLPARGTGLITGTARTGLQRGMGSPLENIARAIRHRELRTQFLRR